MTTALERTFFNAAVSTSDPFDLAMVTRGRRTEGNGFIVFFHGLGCGKSMWEPLLEMADDIDPRTDPYTLVAVDLPGHGETPPSAQLAPCPDVTHGHSAWTTAIHHLVAGIAETGPVHMVAHSASAPMLIEAIHEIDRYGSDTSFTNLGALISIEGNHTAADCGIISERIGRQRDDWYAASGHRALGQELLDEGLVHTLAWARTWERAEAADVHDIAQSLTVMSESEYQILGQHWLNYPRRAYLYGSLSTVPAPTMELMTTIYPQQQTYLRSIPHANHFPMVLSPAETVHAVMDAITHFTKE